ncbi:UDP-N-acetylmuramoyl-L-alanyl-D-glutamate--2,6-diaminopimelate ligase [Oceanivirga salmonicida]|uniref:UDP-N-acetylmuramoyl-L-alanyl-D-glutamate--2, 6-diaminopimelate ligase n=1 Tax=Oceanivirga salmonicida TaxID=1769291 RepID=UPI00082CA813|nr:UDP-N-acetylmuramoyl-L-alanyl-D-glutamate--2,6-diaminopimelate ligase [Oceanivirga salmonicida]
MFENIKYEVLKKLYEDIYTGIEYDSRKIKKGNIFVAMKGSIVDGKNYISNAIEKGASIVLVDDKNIDISKYNVNIYYVENLRNNLGKIAANIYNHPEKNLKILGITGTNGKTTTTYILENILPNSSRIGTTNYRILDEYYNANNTTPESLDLIKLMAKSVEKKVEYFIMEVSSHALSMGRVDMLKFDGAIFTNLSQDHLDYHKTLDEYFNAKCRIIDLLKKDAKISINTDDKYVSTIKDLTIKEKSISFGIETGKIKGKVLEYTNELMKVEIEYNNKKYRLDTKLMGKHNLYNILGVISMLTNLGLDIEYIIDKISKIDAVVGRFELIPNNKNCKIVVDYAHTPDGLENVLRTLKEITKGRVICIFGAGGDRDKTKRPIMAKKAALYSDYIILTSDNPRTENPDEIIDNIEQGLIELAYTNYQKITKRDEAIKMGVLMLKENDSLMIAGKGHEDYQIIGTNKIHFSDKEEVLKNIRK